ncbi:MAG: argininosuccinate lyase [Candidatus Brocadiia bacterium]
MSEKDKLWAGRFEEDTDPLVEEFSESVSFDKRLYKQDIRGSIAHAKMLAHCGLLSESELVQIKETLEEIKREIETETFDFRREHEDIHMNIEAALIDRIGEAGMKLHTARSRNDQVACDFRLWIRGVIDEIDRLLSRCQVAFVERADTFKEMVVPGVTHLQHAQPVLLSHILLAYVEMLQRDRDRLADCRTRVNVSPLGAGAIAGTTLPIDPGFTAEQLEFEKVFENSIDAVSDRDFAMEFVFGLSTIACHLSRLAEDWLIWSTPEFDFIDLDESFCTGSSIMPQKKNPDVLELMRGKTGRIYGHLMSLLTMLKGQPLAYNRDLQEDKRAVFDAADQVRKCLAVLAELVPRTTFKEEQARKACRKNHLDATALADYLVGRGLAFREAHKIVGQIVRKATKDEKTLPEMTLESMQSFSELIAEDVYDYLGPQNCVNHYRSRGSSSADEVQRRLDEWKKQLTAENGRE